MILQDDLAEAPARSRAAVHQQGPQAKLPARQAADQPEQPTDKPDAELVNAHPELSSEISQVWHLAEFIEKYISFVSFQRQHYMFLGLANEAILSSPTSEVTSHWGLDVNKVSCNVGG